MSRVVCGDCMKIMPALPDKFAACTITDIPYGVVNKVRGSDKPYGYRVRPIHRGIADDETFALPDFLDQICRLTYGSIYIFCGTEQVSELRTNLKARGLTTRLIIWEKTNPSPMHGKTVWLSGIECCVYGKFPGAAFNGFCRNTVLRYPLCQEKGKFHPTQKPLPLITDLLVTSTNRGDVVFDPCMGSGTTGVAALSKFREFIGIEMNEEWFIKAKDRLAAVQPNGGFL